MKPWEIVKKLEATSSKLDKEAIIASALKANCLEFFIGVRLCYDPMITFGVKKAPLDASSAKDGSTTIQTFGALASKLSKRELTGHAARDAIQAFCDNCGPNEWANWYRRVLLKDMKAGFTESTVNKVLKAAGRKDLMIPIFTCQLADNAVDTDGNLKDDLLTGKRIVDVKMDGTRCLAVCHPDGRVVLYSRNGKEWLNFGHIAEELSKTFCTKIEAAWVLDGEVMSSSFQDLMKQARRKTNVAANDAILNVFDMIPLKDFMNGKYDLAQMARRHALSTADIETDHVKELGFEVIDFDDEDGQDAFRRINKAAIDGGYEGIMVKDPKAPYRCKRSDDWLKIKPFIEVTLKVTALEEGKAGTKNVGKMGGAVCKGEDEGRQIEVTVGGGWTDKQRKELWDNPKTIVGHLIEVRGDALTKSQNGNTWSLRFPRFKCFRDIKKGEKL